MTYIRELMVMSFLVGSLTLVALGNDIISSILLVLFDFSTTPGIDLVILFFDSIVNGLLGIIAFIFTFGIQEEVNLNIFRKLFNLGFGPVSINNFFLLLFAISRFYIIFTVLFFVKRLQVQPPRVG